MWKWFGRFKTALGRITGISTPLIGLQWERSSATSEDRPELVPLADRLVRYVWDYPLGRGNQESWAVKESAVLRGQLQTAREQPGLGVAIITTEVARSVFGATAEERIDKCLRWALTRTEKEPPYFLLSEAIDPVTSRVTLVSDFRHTLAFAVILARSSRRSALLPNYVEKVLSMQRPDGGWAPGGGATVSEVFAAFYATELMALCASDQQFTPEIRRKCECAREGGFAWLVKNRNHNGLWESGVLSEYAWDDLLSTAWVLHRLSPFRSATHSNWGQCASEAVTRMVVRSMSPSSWRGTEPDQRNRVEARVAAALLKAARNFDLEARTRALVDIYLTAWRSQARGWASNLPDSALDVGTASFLVEALLERAEVSEAASRALAQASNGPGQS